MKLTLLVTKGEAGYFIGQIKEIPGVITQGKSLEEVKENIRDAFELYMEDMRDEPTDTAVVAEEEFIVA